MHKRAGWTIATFSVAGVIAVALQGGSAIGEDIFDHDLTRAEIAAASVDAVSSTGDETVEATSEATAETVCDSPAQADGAEAPADSDAVVKDATSEAQAATNAANEQDATDGQAAAEAAAEVDPVLGSATAPAAEGSSEAQPAGNSAAKAATPSAAPAVSNGIPVLSVDIDPDEYNNVISDRQHDYKAKGARIRIDVPEGYKGVLGTEELQGLADTPLDYFRGRGNTSWTGDKKPFKMKLDKKQGLLGMNKSKHWALLSNELDDSMLRNRLMSYMAQELGMEYTPKMVPVDFVINGKYQGSYLLSSTVRIGKDSVDIDELEAGDIAGSNVTGGYLVGLHPYMKEAFENVFVTTRGMDFKLDGPDFSETDDAGNTAPGAQKDYITSYLQKVEDIIYTDGFVDENGVALDEYLDLESAANYWWMQEFCCNMDAFKTPSNYLYKKRDGKLYWGPVWDFDLAFVFNDSTIDSLNTANPMPWMDKLRAHHPGFQRLLRERWEELDKLLANITRDGGVLDQYANEIKASWQGNYDELYANSYRPHVGFDEAISTLKNGIEARRAAIATKIDENLTKVFVDVTFKLGNEVLSKVELKPGQSLMNSFPEPPTKEGYTFKCWEDDAGNEVEQWGTASSEMNIHAVLVAADGVTRYEGEPAADGDAKDAGEGRQESESPAAEGNGAGEGAGAADGDDKRAPVAEAASTASDDAATASAKKLIMRTTSKDGKGASGDAKRQTSDTSDAQTAPAPAASRDEEKGVKAGKPSEHANLPKTSDPVDAQGILALMSTGVLALITGHFTRKGC